MSVPTHTDINECETNNTCDEHADCHDTDGSYWCECSTGFLGDGYNCTGNVYIPKYYSYQVVFVGGWG